MTTPDFNGQANTPTTPQGVPPTPQAQPNQAQPPQQFQQYPPQQQQFQQPSPYPQQGNQFNNFPQQGMNNQPYQPNPGISPKSGPAALIICLLLNGFGAYDFYRGKIGQGVGHLALYLVGAVLYFFGYAAYLTTYESWPFVLMAISSILLIATGVWAIVDLIKLATGKSKDSKGLIVKISQN